MDNGFSGGNRMVTVRYATIAQKSYLIDIIVRPAGFEPATSGLEVQKECYYSHMLTPTQRYYVDKSPYYERILKV